MKFRKSVVIPASQEALFEFHQNPHNLIKISPPGFAVKKIEASSRAKKGETFRVVASTFGVPLHWVGTWVDVQRPTILIDSAKVFPFSAWRHEHSFRKVKNGTEMTDDLEYRIRWFLGGELTARTIFALFFTIIFAARHRSTVKLFKR